MSIALLDTFWVKNMFCWGVIAKYNLNVQKAGILYIWRIFVHLDVHIREGDPRVSKYYEFAAQTAINT